MVQLSLFWLFFRPCTWIRGDFNQLKILMLCQDMPAIGRKRKEANNIWRIKWKKRKICDEIARFVVQVHHPGSVTWPAKLQGRRFTRFFSPDSLRHPSDPTWCDRVDRANGSTVNVSRILVSGMWVMWVCLVCWHSVGLTWFEVWWSICWIGVLFVPFGQGKACLAIECNRSFCWWFAQFTDS